MNSILLRLATILFLASPVIASAALENIEKPDSMDKLNPSKSCGFEGCHSRIYSEWSNSIHFQSTSVKDPLVGAFYDFLEKRGTNTTEKCDKCHSPLRAIYGGKKEYEKNPVNQEGVSCLFCHSVYGTHDKKAEGIEYYKLNFNEVGTGPYHQSDESVHDVKFISLFRSVDMCGGCHKYGETDYILTEGRKTICQNCHMPAKQKKRSSDLGKVREKVYRHLFEGGHSPLLLNLAVILSGKAHHGEDHTTLNLLLENSAHHVIPTGFPYRAIYVKVTALDSGGKILWQNFKNAPYEEDPKSYFGLIFNEKDVGFSHHGRETIPVYKQVIPANGRKSISYRIPLSDVDQFKVEVFYRLLSRQTTEKLNIDPTLTPEVLMVKEIIPVF